MVAARVSRRATARTAVVAVLGVLGLGLAPAEAWAAGSLDQQQTQASGGSAIVGLTPPFSGAPTSWAQTFTAGMTGALDRIDVDLTSSIYGDGPVGIELRTVSGGVPSSTVLASALTSDPIAEGWNTVTFATPPRVLAGTQYAIVATNSGSEVDWLLSSNTNPYAGGTNFTDFGDGAGWASNFPDYDLTFKTYVELTDADLSLTMSGPSTVRKGSSATYVLVMRNAGPVTAHHVVLTDNLPYGSQVTSVQSTQGSCTPPSRTASTVTCNLGDIASGADVSSGLTIKITARASSGFLNNVASVSSDQFDPNTSNNSASLSTTVSK